jgi:outer membrane biosynthesis protein TonB
VEELAPIEEPAEIVEAEQQPVAEPAELAEVQPMPAEEPVEVVEAEPAPIPEPLELAELEPAPAEEPIEVPDLEIEPIEEPAPLEESVAAVDEVPDESLQPEAPQEDPKFLSPEPDMLALLDIEQEVAPRDPSAQPPKQTVEERELSLQELETQRRAMEERMRAREEQREREAERQREEATPKTIEELLAEQASRANAGGETGYQTERSRSLMRGNIDRRGQNSIEADASALGVYNKEVSSAIGRVWNSYVRADSELMKIGTVTVRFTLDEAGDVIALSVVKNTSGGEVLASKTVLAIYDADIPPIPEDVLADIGRNGMDIEFSFSVY